MVWAYGIITLISLCMLGICVLADKKRDIWLLFVFVSVALCNLGYFMISISENLADALNSNRISYLGSVFLPFFMLMMVLRFCGIRRNKIMTGVLVALGIVVLAITNTPGILPVYYSTVDIAFVNGATKLVREYGPLHSLYYVYLIGYMLAMIGVAFYAIRKRRIRTRTHTVMLVLAVFCNIAIWLIEQFLPRGFEWLSVSYIITECLILAIYHSMQRQGLLMENEKKRTYTINVLLAVFLLLFANFVSVATKGETEAIYIISQVTIFAIYIGILIAWIASVYDRIVDKVVRNYLMVIAALMMLWMLMRMLRFAVFYYVFPAGQWCWYAYYISMILIPQICLFASKYLGKPESYRMSRKMYIMYIPSFILIAGILTNDMHQLAFSFPQGYEAGWDIYHRGILYYMAAAWIFSCIALMIVEIIKSCRIPGTKKIIWTPVTMFGIGVGYSILYATGIHLFTFIEMTAALCFTIVAIWECSIKTGLIQSNTNYENLLKYSGYGVSVTDRRYMVQYHADDAVNLSKEQMKNAVENSVMAEGGIRVSGSEIRGGYALWQEDLSELLEILEELNILREELKDSNLVYMRNYQLNKQMRALAEKNRLHDEIHRQTAHQINLLNDWLIRLGKTDDSNVKRELLRRIVVVGAYLKRRNNIILISKQDGVVSVGEINQSIREMIKNLHLAGVQCAVSMQLDEAVPSDVVTKLFDFYEYVVEYAFDSLEYLLVRFFRRDNDFYCCVDLVCDADMKALESDTVSVSVSEEGYCIVSFKVEGGMDR